MVNRKMILYLAIALILIALISGLVYSIIGSTVDTTALCVSGIDVSDKKLNIAGTTSSSALAFSGYDYTIVNDSLYLKLRYALVTRFHKNGSFNITIIDNLNDVNKVYMQGKDQGDSKLVWSK